MLNGTHVCVQYKVRWLFKVPGQYRFVGADSLQVLLPGLATGLMGLLF